MTKMMLNIICVFVEWAFLRSLWIPFVAATSSSKSIAKHSTLPASIQRDKNKDEDDDEFSWLPAFVGVGTRSSTRSGSSSTKSHDSATQLAARPTRTEMSTTANIRSLEPQLPNYSWDNPAEDVESNFINGSTVVPEEVMDLVQAPLVRSIMEGPPSVDDFESSSDFDTQEETLPQSETFGYSPVVYRYFGRSRARTRSCDSIPFIFLGPSVDHWKSTGETLASRGFSVMACERLHPDDNDASNLILAVLDALRWNRVILVGCDKESAVAIQAALELAPDRIAGLVLCGDLSTAEAMLSRTTPDGRSHALDRFLIENLDCPHTLIWGGDGSHRNTASSSLSDDLISHRCLILGGGSAPHRRQPEHFAWTLTRFVEEKVVPPLPSHNKPPSRSQIETEIESKKFALPFGLDTIVAPGFLLVAGRVIASAIIFTSFGRVFLYQYENFHQGMILFQSHAKLVQSWPKRLLLATASFVFRNRKKDDIEPVDLHSSSMECEEDIPLPPPVLSNEVQLKEAIKGDTEEETENKKVEFDSKDGGTKNSNRIDNEFSGHLRYGMSPYYGLMFLDHVIT